LFEQEIETITRSLQTSLLPPGRTSVPVKDILASDAPHTIKAFFRADVETLLYNEQQAYQKTSQFRHGHPEVRSLQTQMNSILILHYEYGAEEFTTRLTGAVQMIVNYLLRPQWTLAGVIFEREQAISAQGLIATFHYFGAYDYLKDIITRYLQDKKPPSVSRNDLVSLLWKADSEYMLRKTGDELARILTPMFEFFEYPSRGGATALPTKAFLRFFDDKGLMTVVSHLEGELAQGKTAITRRELAEILEAVRRNSGPFRAERSDHAAARVAEIPEAIMEQPSDPPTETIAPPAPVELPFEPVAAAPQTFAAASQTIAAAPPTVVAEPAPRGIIPPVIEQLMNDNERKRFVKKIFGQDENAYTTALHALASAATWKQASKYLDEIFIHHDVDPYSSDAERFVDIVFDHFHPKQ
jgi:hypothetical protein